MYPVPPNFPMPIITPRLFIRPPQLKDTPTVGNAIVDSISILSPFMPWARYTPTMDDTAEFITQACANWILKRNEEPYLPLLIFDKKTNEFVGAVGMHKWDWSVPRIEIGYWLNKPYLNKGLMSEAVNALTRYAFLALGVVRCSIYCGVDNERSKKIPQRLNYTLEGVLKNNVRKVQTNELTDTAIYAIYDLNNLPPLEVSWGNDYA